MWPVRRRQSGPGTFEEQDGKTLMTIIQKGFSTAERWDGDQVGLPNALAQVERVRTDGSSRATGKL